MTARAQAQRALLALSLLACFGCVPPPPADSAPPGAGRATVAWLGKGPGELYRPGEVRAWRIVQGGHEVGRSWGRYLGPDPAAPGHHVFETRIELRLPARPVARSAGRLVLDARGHVVEGEEVSDAARIEFRRDGDRLRLRAGDREDEVTYAPERADTAAWGASAILHEEIMLGLRPLAPGEVSWRVVSLSGGVPVQWRAEVEASADGVLHLDTSLGEELRVQGGRILSLRVAADDLVIEAVRRPTWPRWTVAGPRTLTYAPPAGADFTIRPLAFAPEPNEPALAGEVLVPEAPGPHPGVLFLSGAGRQDRHGFAGPPPVDLGSHFITDALAQAGMVVLRYDERGFGGSESAPVTFEGQLSDARRAMGMLMVQPEVDPRRLAIVGHGEGGWRALILAATDPNVRAVVLLGTPGRRYREIVLHQSETTMAELPPAVRADARKTLELLLDRLAAEDAGAAPADLGPEREWLRGISRVDPRRLFRGVEARVLIVQGDKDFEVDPEADPAALERAARAAGVDARVERLSGLDHRLMPEPGVSTPARYLEPGGEVAPEAISRVVEFLRGALAAK